MIANKFTVPNSVNKLKAQKWYLKNNILFFNRVFNGERMVTIQVDKDDLKKSLQNKCVFFFYYDWHTEWPICNTCILFSFFFFLKHLLPSKFRWSFSDSKILSNNSEQSNSSQFLPLLHPVQHFRKNKEIKTQSCCYCLLHVSKNLGKTRNSPLKVIRESPAYSWNRRGREKRWQCS